MKRYLRAIVKNLLVQLVPVALIVAGSAPMPAECQLAIIQIKAEIASLTKIATNQG
jgi:NADH:ubiquinone oxidoreductase subunit B-like Fe-S oxidoreductase